MTFAARHKNRRVLRLNPIVRLDAAAEHFRTAGERFCRGVERARTGREFFRGVQEQRRCFKAQKIRLPLTSCWSPDRPASAQGSPYRPTVRTGTDFVHRGPKRLATSGPLDRMAL